MTILEALQSKTNYPIPENAIETICIDRGLNSASTYYLTVGQSREFQLATADVYMWIVNAWNVSEQNISLSKSNIDSFFSMAQTIYSHYEDAKFSGNRYGFVGEDWNA